MLLSGLTCRNDWCNALCAAIQGNARQPGCQRQLYIYIYIYRVFSWIRNFLAGTAGLGTHFYYKLTTLGQNTYFAMFSMSLVCVVGTFVSYLTAVILHTFQDFEFASLKPFLSSCLRFFFEMPSFIVFGGFDSDWLDKQAFAPIFQF